ncbi:MAG: ester cyclase [Actinobacteria bacterium]|nr:ester cyclase [Actinomycetota bacterium]
MGPADRLPRLEAPHKVAEHRGVMDNLAMMQQLGVIPEEPPAG